MGKLVLGIMAVILVQISFVLYMSNDGEAVTTASVGSAAAETVTSDGGPDLVLNRTDDGESVTAFPAPATDGGHRTHSRPTTARNTFADQLRVQGFSGRGARREQVQRTDVHQRRSSEYAAFSVRPESDVQKQFFGKMVVERKYAVSANRMDRAPKSRVQREIFGRMMVERTFEISDNRAKNRSKPKKQPYLASNVPVLKKSLA